MLDSWSRTKKSSTWFVEGCSRQCPGCPWDFSSTHPTHTHSTHMAPYVVMGTHAHTHTHPSHHSAPTLVSLHLSLPKHAMRPLINFTVRQIIEINKIDTTHPLEPRTTEQPETKSQHFQTQKTTHIMHRLHCTKKTHFANT